jgi:hypothetical protein
MSQVQTLNERAWPMPEIEPPPADFADPAEQYRRTAEKLRQLAQQIRFDLGRQQQLLSLADAFERLADRKETAGAGLNRPPA